MNLEFEKNYILKKDLNSLLSSVERDTRENKLRTNGVFIKNIYSIEDKLEISIVNDIILIVNYNNQTNVSILGDDYQTIDYSKSKIETLLGGKLEEDKKWHKQQRE